MTLTYRKILLPLDGSALAAAALPHARRLALLFGVELLVVRAVADLHERNLHYVPAGMAPQVTDYTQGLLARWVAEVEAEQAQVVDELRAAGVQATAVVESGDATALILDVAEREAVDLIVMATHGRSGLARWVYGSVAEKVLQAASCPVLLVRSVLPTTATATGATATGATATGAASTRTPSMTEQKA
jgi:nucleotide-binding universal stress UspA family protein